MSRVYAGPHTLPTNRNYQSPTTSQKLTVLNTRINDDMIAMGCSSRAPKYPRADGEFRDRLGDAPRGAIVFTFVDLDGGSDAISYDAMGAGDPTFPRSEHATTLALTVLNGQGHSTDTQESFEQRCRILGVVEADKPIDKVRFTTLLGGHLTIPNTGPHRICNGQLVIARAPTEDDLRSCRDHNKETKLGVIRFQTHPYDPSLHRNSLKEIWMCLRDTSSKKAYLPQYKRHCRELTDSVSGMAMTLIARSLDTIAPLIATAANAAESSATRATALENILREWGHSEVVGLATSGASRMPSDLIDTLFAPYSSRENGNEVPFLFPQRQANQTQRKLNEIQKRSTGQFLESTASFYHQLMNLVLGRATTSANSGDDMNIHLFPK